MKIGSLFLLMMLSFNVMGALHKDLYVRAVSNDGDKKRATFHINGDELIDPAGCVSEGEPSYYEINEKYDYKGAQSILYVAMMAEKRVNIYVVENPGECGVYGQPLVKEIRLFK